MPHRANSHKNLFSTLVLASADFIRTVCRGRHLHTAVPPSYQRATSVVYCVTQAHSPCAKIKICLAPVWAYYTYLPRAPHTRARTEYRRPASASLHDFHVFPKKRVFPKKMGAASFRRRCYNNQNHGIKSRPPRSSYSKNNHP